MTIDRDGEGPPLRRDDARAPKGGDELRASAFTEDVFDDEYYGRRRRSGGISFGVIAGIVFAAASAAVTGWYFLASRSMSNAGSDASSQVVQADPSPYKIKPEDPGGLQVDNQDKLIYDRVAKSASPSRVENLLPAPEEPHAPPVKAPEATPAPAASTPAAADSTPPAQDPLAALMAQVDSSSTAPAPSPAGAPMAVVSVAKPAPQTDVPPPAPAPAAATEEANPAPAKTAGSPLLLVPAEAPSDASSDATPTTVAAASAEPTAVPSMPAQPSAQLAPAQTAAAPAATGAVMIQLASAHSEEAAMGEWKRINGKNADLLTGLSPTVTQADVPNIGTMYRLRAGPLADKATADSLCLALAVRNVKCIVARP